MRWNILESKNFNIYTTYETVRIQEIPDSKSVFLVAGMRLDQLFGELKFHKSTKQHFTNVPITVMLQSVNSSLVLEWVSGTDLKRYNIIYIWCALIEHVVC